MSTAGLGFDDSTALLARKLGPDVENWLQHVTKSMAQTSLDRATRAVLRGREAGQTVAEISRSLRTRHITRSKARADMVARSATIWNYNEGAQAAYEDNGIVQKEWLTTDDDVLDDECAALSGTRTDIRGEFPGGVGHPPLHPNCRCAIVPVLDDVERAVVEEEPVENAVSSTESPEQFRSFDTDKEAKKWADDSYKKWGSDLSSSEKDALWRYQGSVHERINTGLRTGKRLGKVEKAFVKRLDAALENAVVRENVTVYRGFKHPDITKNWNRLVGKTVTDKGYASTTLYKDTAEYFRKQSKGVMAEIRIPKGARAGWLGGVADASEGELLLARGTKYRIVETSVRNKVKHIVMELIL